jgi:site-specific recombinase XerD
MVVSADLARSFPSVTESLQKASKLFEQIKSFDDLERLFLKGSGLSPNTYRSYLEAVKQFYQFTKGLNPLQVRPADIEAFYDDLVARVDRNTAYLRMRGLKKFFEGVRNVVPFYASPFDIMGEKLHAKLNCTKKGNRTKKTLTREELKALLEFLRQDTSTTGRENYALVFMLATSGLRASELCALRWGDLGELEGKWTALFIGKGDKEAEQELFAPAVEACRLYFLRQFRRVPKPEDALFWTVPIFRHQTPASMTPHTLWTRIKGIGTAAVDARIIARELQFSPHLFRRSYATLLYKSGMKLKAIQNLTRHASIETLCKHYVDDSEPATPYLANALASKEDRVSREETSLPR